MNYKRTMVLIGQLKENPEKWELVEDLFLAVKRAANTVKIKTLKSSRLTSHSITERVNNYSMHYKGANLYLKSKWYLNEIEKEKNSGLRLRRTNCYEERFTKNEVLKIRKFLEFNCKKEFHFLKGRF